MLPPELAGRLKRAIRLHQSGEVLRAERIYREVIAADAGAADAWHMLAIAQADQGLLEPAAQAAQSATDLQPRIAQYWLTRGRIAAERRDESEAQASSGTAAELEPRFAEAYFDLGKSYEREERLPEAIAAYRAALERDPAPAELHYFLARTLLRSGEPQEAIESYQRAFERDPEGALDRRECLDFLRKLKFEALPDFWQADALRFFKRGDVDRTRYAPGGLSVLMAKDAFQKVCTAAESGSGLEALGAELYEVTHDPLFGLLLAEALLANPGFELLLARLRREFLLNDASRAAAPLEFLSNLAQQCFINEFVYLETQDETVVVEALAREVESTLGSQSQPGEREMHSIAALATYRPLHAVRHAQALLAIQWPSAAFAQLVRRSVGNVFEERALRTTIRALGQIKDAVSQQVRAQYEENPYPRWLSFDRQPPIPAAAWIAADAPLDAPLSLPAEPRILVAGCGSGRDPLYLAAAISDARVTAIDLSLASLAYARRMAKEFGIRNIEFLQADILELDDFAPKFDAVYSLGVLHHMHDPQAGLAVLSRQAKPGGLIKLGLYSRRGRPDVNAARELIRQRKVEPTAAGIRAFRQEFLRVDRSSPLWGLTRSRDFFSMSECRDLLFHVHEHQFDLAGVLKLLEETGLECLGLSKQADRSALLAYRRMFPGEAPGADLRKWHALEERHPEMFRGMYPVWCRVPR